MIYVHRKIIYVYVICAFTKNHIYPSTTTSDTAQISCSNTSSSTYLAKISYNGEVLKWMHIALSLNNQIKVKGRRTDNIKIQNGSP